MKESTSNVLALITILVTFLLVIGGVVYASMDREDKTDTAIQQQQFILTYVDDELGDIEYRISGLEMRMDTTDKNYNEMATSIAEGNEMTQDLTGEIDRITGMVIAKVNANTAAWKCLEVGEKGGDRLTLNCEKRQ